MPNTHNNSLELVLMLEKNDYFGDDPILPFVTLKNISNHDLWVNKRMALNDVSAAGEMAFVIIPPTGEGNKFQYWVNIHEPDESDFIKLPPSESTSRQFQYPFDLQSAYDLKDYGAYSIQAIYENQSQPNTGVIAWTGEIKSNIVRFRLKP